MFTMRLIAESNDNKQFYFALTLQLICISSFGKNFRFIFPYKSAPI